jgi:TatD DNase family protein
VLIDTHAHLNAEQFKEDLEIVIERAIQSDVEKIIVVGFDRKTIQRAIQLAEKYPFIYAVVGWHPEDAVDCTEADLNWIEDLAKHPKVVGIGEIGLDYYWDKSPKEIQQKLLRRQIQLAKKENLPIIIHNRDATQDLIRILREERASEVGGVMHCFSGSAETAEECVKMNFYISLAGPVTFKNARQPKEVVERIPLEKLLIETDCPYLAPHPYRGKRNEPALVKLVAEEIALIKNQPYDTVAKVTTENAKRIFRIED